MAIDRLPLQPSSYTNREDRCEVGPTKTHREPNVVKQLDETTMNDLYSSEDVLWFPILPIYFTFAVISYDMYFHCIDFHYTAKRPKPISFSGSANQPQPDLVQKMAILARSILPCITKSTHVLCIPRGETKFPSTIAQHNPYIIGYEYNPLYNPIT